MLLCTLASQNEDNYVQDACSVTHYQDLCIHTLASFSHIAKHSPSRWARAGVSVTIAEAKRVSKYLKTNRSGMIIEGRNKVALLDCIECFIDTLDNLHKSLGVLRKLSFRDFDSQMGDVTTWLSAALTDEDTCLDGFHGHEGRVVEILLNRVSNVTCMTSNALALVNKLATTGPEALQKD
ncbi:Plant invertase/pectin methylesterase inhibitor superfamily protein [Abeliophyllum distichum]|uniref:Plant invertase/pectin methylesterase inhibitor superfamily protein n=1 Tax=Abeliophyllum distichum TaxID=126358 RepID=A0ABD1TCT7_9LAMI